MWIFYVIVMINKKGKKMYLKCGNGNAMEWSYDKNQGCWYDTQKEAIEFAERYFKNFNAWKIEEIEYTM